jgi:hypothetical protein
VYTRHILSGCSALIGVSLLFPLSARAESTDSDKIQLLERQTEMLQEQLKEIKDELARTRKKTDQIEAKTKSEPVEAQSPSASVANTVSAEVPVAPRVAKAKPSILPEGVNVTVGGFLAAETVWRQRNMVNDIGTNFNAIPYPFSPLFNENEFHGTARQSRISLLAEGNLDPYQKLSGYFEVDFRGAANSSNYVESNSWAPRLRQAFGQYDNTGTGFHVLAGQAWSMLTQNTVGITPRKENIPLTIDANYVVGFNYTRNMQVRFWEQFNSAVAAGVSVESPQFIFGGSQTTFPFGLGLVGGGAFPSGGFVNGLEVNFQNTGTGDLAGVTVTTDQLPDVIEKLVLDPGWGHYEVFAIQRFFTDNILNCAPFACGPSVTTTGSAYTKTSFGEGIGGSVLMPVVPKYLDFTANVMYGQGIGRYGAAQLPDVTIASDGSLTPLLEFTTMLGLVGHPWEGLDVYAYAGFEQVHASYFNTDGNFNFGFGNPGFSNAGCYVMNSASFGGALPANCIANNKRVGDITGGFWQNLYKGEYGRVAVGAQYEYIKRYSFNGVGGAVTTDDNIVMTSIRYYPFN